MERLSLSTGPQVLQEFGETGTVCLSSGKSYVDVTSGMQTLAQTQNWQQVRDNSLGPDQEALNLSCQRGQEANQQGLSTFNDEWVLKI